MPCSLYNIFEFSFIVLRYEYVYWFQSFYPKYNVIIITLLWRLQAPRSIIINPITCIEIHIMNIRNSIFASTKHSFYGKNIYQRVFQNQNSFLQLILIPISSLSFYFCEFIFCNGISLEITNFNLYSGLGHDVRLPMSIKISHGGWK